MPTRVISQQLWLWNEPPPAVAEPDEPPKPPTCCSGRIVKDGQALWYMSGLLEGEPRYGPRPDLEAIYQNESVLPTDLIQRCWKRCPSKPIWLMQQRWPGDVIIVMTGGSLDESIAMAREIDRLADERQAWTAAAEAAKAAKEPKRKKAAA